VTGEPGEIIQTAQAGAAPLENYKQASKSESPMQKRIRKIIAPSFTIKKANLNVAKIGSDPVGENRGTTTSKK